MSESPAKPETSVIVSSYNEPKDISKELIALRRQIVLPGEVLVAYDGSTGEAGSSQQL